MTRGAGIFIFRVSLVPCFAFGENDLYDQIDNPEGSVLKALQRRLTRVLGFSMPLFKGRGVFNYTVGILPRRRPITTVSECHSVATAHYAWTKPERDSRGYFSVGEPLPVVKKEKPTQEDIDDLHAKYVDALTDLFENHKEEYGIDKRRHLTLV